MFANRYFAPRYFPDRYFGTTSASAPAITIKRRRVGRSSMRVLLDKPLWREIADMQFSYMFNLSTFSYQKMNKVR